MAYIQRFSVLRDNTNTFASSPDSSYDNAFVTDPNDGRHKGVFIFTLSSKILRGGGGGGGGDALMGIGPGVGGLPNSFSTSGALGTPPALYSRQFYYNFHKWSLTFTIRSISTAPPTSSMNVNETSVSKERQYLSCYLTWRNQSNEHLSCTVDATITLIHPYHYTNNVRLDLSNCEYNRTRHSYGSPKFVSLDQLMQFLPSTATNFTGPNDRAINVNINLPSPGEHENNGKSNSKLSKSDKVQTDISDNLKINSTLFNQSEPSGKDIIKPVKSTKKSYYVPNVMDVTADSQFLIQLEMRNIRTFYEQTLNLLEFYYDVASFENNTAFSDKKINTAESDGREGHPDESAEGGDKSGTKGFFAKKFKNRKKIDNKDSGTRYLHQFLKVASGHQEGGDTTTDAGIEITHQNGDVLTKNRKSHDKVDLKNKDEIEDDSSSLKPFGTLKRPRVKTQFKDIQILKPVSQAVTPGLARTGKRKDSVFDYSSQEGSYFTFGKYDMNFSLLPEIELTEGDNFAEKSSARAAVAVKTKNEDISKPEKDSSHIGLKQKLFQVRKISSGDAADEHRLVLPEGLIIGRKKLTKSKKKYFYVLKGFHLKLNRHTHLDQQCHLNYRVTIIPYPDMSKITKVSTLPNPTYLSQTTSYTSTNPSKSNEYYNLPIVNLEYNGEEEQESNILAVPNTRDDDYLESSNAFLSVKPNTPTINTLSKSPSTIFPKVRMKKDRANREDNDDNLRHGSIISTKLVDLSTKLVSTLGFKDLQDVESSDQVGALPRLSKIIKRYRYKESIPSIEIPSIKVSKPDWLLKGYCDLVLREDPEDLLLYEGEEYVSSPTFSSSGDFRRNNSLSKRKRCLLDATVYLNFDYNSVPTHYMIDEDLLPRSLYFSSHAYYVNVNAKRKPSMCTITTSNKTESPINPSTEIGSLAAHGKTSNEDDNDVNKPVVDTAGNKRLSVWSALTNINQVKGITSATPSATATNYILHNPSNLKMLCVKPAKIDNSKTIFGSSRKSNKALSLDKLSGTTSNYAFDDDQDYAFPDEDMTSDLTVNQKINSTVRSTNVSRDSTIPSLMLTGVESNLFALKVVVFVELMSVKNITQLKPFVELGKFTLENFYDSASGGTDDTMEQTSWCLEVGSKSGYLNFNLYYSDIMNIPRNHLRYVSWTISLLADPNKLAVPVASRPSSSTDTHSQKSEKDTKKTTITKKITADKILRRLSSKFSLSIDQDENQFHSNSTSPKSEIKLINTIPAELFSLRKDTSNPYYDVNKPPTLVKDLLKMKPHYFIDPVILYSTPSSQIYSKYYVQQTTNSDNGVSMRTPQLISELLDPKCPFLWHKSEIVVRIEWFESILLNNSSYNKNDDLIFRQYLLMKDELDALRKENYSLEKEMFRYQNAIALKNFP